MTDPVLDLDALTLAYGAHWPAFEGDACVVECSNLIAAGRVRVPDWTPRCPLAAVPFADDHPSISRVIRAYVIGLNDAWNDADRQRLKPYATRILCTATTEADEETRAWMAVDWLVRICTPAFLRLAGLTEDADALASLARITDAARARAVQPTIAAAAARAVAREAVGAAAVGEAVGEAWAAAREAVGAVARAAVGAAARAAVGAAARASRATVVTVVAALQASALELLDQMIAVGQPEVTP